MYILVHASIIIAVEKLICNLQTKNIKKTTQVVILKTTVYSRTVFYHSYK